MSKSEKLGQSLSMALDLKSELKIKQRPSEIDNLACLKPEPMFRGSQRTKMDLPPPKI